MKNKNGISLIVLVIIVVVMIILAATIIISLNNSGIIGKAETAVKDYNEVEVRHIAELAWSDAYLDPTITTQEQYETAVITALTNNGVDTSQYVITVTTTGVTIFPKTNSNNPNVENSSEPWVQNGTTVTRGSTILNVGDTVTNYNQNYNASDETIKSEWKVLGAENGNLLLTTITTVGTPYTLVGSADKWDDTNKKWTSLENELNGLFEADSTSVYYINKGANAISLRSINLDDIIRVMGMGQYNTQYGTEEVVTSGYWDPPTGQYPFTYFNTYFTYDSSEYDLTLQSQSLLFNVPDYWLSSTLVYYMLNGGVFSSLQRVKNKEIPQDPTTSCLWDASGASSASLYVRPVVEMSSSFIPSI